MNTHPEWLIKSIELRTAKAEGASGMKPLAGRFVVQHTNRTHLFGCNPDYVSFVAEFSWAVLDVTMRDENGCWLIVKDGFTTAKAAKEYAKGLVK